MTDRGPPDTARVRRDPGSPLHRHASMIVGSRAILPWTNGATIASEATAVSHLRSDEHLIFFTTDAHLAEDGESWHVPVHVWVHEPEETKLRKGAFASALKSKYGLAATPATRDNFDRRVGLFVVDNERGKRIVVDVAGQRVTLPKTGANGHASTVITVNVDRVNAAAAGGRLTITAVLPAEDAQRFTGTVNLVAPEGLSVISDIDDTVKVTEMADRAAMFDRTFFRDFEAVPGMAALYRDWAARGAVFHYVSSSPWHLYEPLDAFLTDAAFPCRSLSLKRVRLKDRTLLDLFRKGTATKPAQIEPILQRYPKRQFVLVGDSGEHDPEVYAALLRKYPAQVVRVYIHNVSGATVTNPRFSALFAGIERDRWALFEDPSSLRLPPPPAPAPAP